MEIDGFDIDTVEGSTNYLKSKGVDVEAFVNKGIVEIKRKKALDLYRVSGSANDLGHGKCKEKGCDRWATKDYNGHGHWNCDTCYDRNERYFEDEYR